jgi:hypothetical protein
MIQQMPNGMIAGGTYSNCFIGWRAYLYVEELRVGFPDVLDRWFAWLRSARQAVSAI